MITRLTDQSDFIWSVGMIAAIEFWHQQQTTNATEHTMPIASDMTRLTELQAAADVALGDALMRAVFAHQSPERLRLIAAYITDNNKSLFAR